MVDLRTKSEGNFLCMSIMFPTVMYNGSLRITCFVAYVQALFAPGNSGQSSAVKLRSHHLAEQKIATYTVGLFH